MAGNKSIINLYMRPSITGSFVGFVCSVHGRSLRFTRFLFLLKVRSKRMNEFMSE